MNRSFISRTLLSSIFLTAIFSTVQAKLSVESEKNYTGYYTENKLISLSVSHEYLQQDGKSNSKNKSATNPKPKQPDIKTVPKARKQPRPAIVSKPKANVKPAKVAHPNIKKP